MAVYGLFAFDFNIRPRGFVFLPLGDGNIAADGNERYSTTGGGDIGLEIDLASIWPNHLGIGFAAGIEGGLLLPPLKNSDDGNFQLYSFGGDLGLYYFPLSRLFTRLDAAFGVYQGIGDAGIGKPGMWWRFGGEAGVRFTPAFTLAANGGWRQYESVKNSGAFNSGVYAGLTAQLTFEVKGGRARADGVGADFAQDDGVYPVYLSLYQQNPVGTITIRNNENAEIRDVRVSFRGGTYTASEFQCGTIPLIAKGRGVDLPLYVDFSPELLNFTDSGRILGEVIIRYSFLGKEREAARTAMVRVHNRNTFSGGDWTGLAAFVSPTSPEVLEYAKYITGMARTERRAGLNQNMQFGMWLFEGLRANGIGVSSNKEQGTDNREIQFPAQTLAYRSGSVFDVGLLYAGALEAAGIQCAIIPLDTDFVVAIGLGIGEAAAGTLFNGTGRLLIVDNEVWLPLSMGALDSGFTKAWDAAALGLKERFSAGESLDFIFVEDAWGIYPPAPFPTLGVRISQSGREMVRRGAATALTEYTAAEIEPLVREAQRNAQSSGSAAGYNRLAVLQVRAGRMVEAKSAFERAAVMGSVSAMINRGNLALNEKDYTAAERWYKQALQVQPDNASAIRGMEQVTGNK
jgi:hypothetical protein